MRTRRTTCLHCGGQLTNEQYRRRKQYCRVEHAYADRPNVVAREREARERAILQARRDLQAWMRRRYARQAARARARALQGVL